MTLDARRRKALSILREGRLTVVLARSDMAKLVPYEVVAQVRGYRGTYAVDLHGGEWGCTCRDEQPCGHVAAAGLVTGAATATVRERVPA